MDQLLSLTSSAFEDLAAARYMSAVGLIVLLYDHCLTLADEVAYIWPAPATFAKYTFLLNRYAVLGTLLAVAYEMCGFVDTPFSDLFVFTCSMLAIISVGIANLLILQRVVILWEHRPIILKIMTTGYLLSFTLQVVTMVLTLVNVLPNIQWGGPLGMCVATKSSHVLVAVWASPLVFEMFVLTSTALNALDRPRTVELPIIKALHSDGLGFFLAITCCRILNLVLAALSRPSLTFLGVFFIWAMTTTILNRLLLHLRRAECLHLSPSSPLSGGADPDADPEEDMDEVSSELWDRRRSRAISPFGLIPLTRNGSRGSGKRMSGSSQGDHDHEAGYGHGHGRWASDVSDITPMPYVYHYQKRTNDPYVRPWD
ncbi:hypothetical protein BV20DRAFT_740331 [Pilatotrama ljubarskyi]|nr:hypothetical protein BV20DRAFT_740331 [Pilatotrama ljubarskyi]